jgi:hypothetical protein
MSQDVQVVPKDENIPSGPFNDKNHQAINAINIIGIIENQF